MYLVFLPINVATFLIPSFISIGMMYFNKTNSSLVNYIFNDYIVDISNQDIYFNDMEREEAIESLKSLTLDNKDFSLK